MADEHVKESVVSTTGK